MVVFLGPDLIQAYEDTHGGSTEVFILFTSFVHKFGYMCRTLTSHMNVCEGVKTIMKIMVAPFLFGTLPESVLSLTMNIILRKQKKTMVVWPR